MNTPNTPSSSETSTGPAPQARGRRRGLFVGGAAGVLGGGLVGLALTLPSFTDAASQDTTAVAVVDDGGVAGPMHHDEADRGVHLREALQALVDDGTITAEQADAVAEHLVANAPRHGGPGGDEGPGGRGGPGRRGGPGFDGEVVAEVLGIDVETLREAAVSGQSIADLAEANGVDPQTVIDALVAEAQGHLDLAVESGRLSEDEAAAKAAELTERITARVNGEIPPRR